jgi:predicted ABC-type transport system involved in lysophospholipase L1 biosynthesis ATPase subunit
MDRRKVAEQRLAAPIVRAEGLTKQVTTPDHELTIVKGASFVIRTGEAVAIHGA